MDTRRSPWRRHRVGLGGYPRGVSQPISDPAGGDGPQPVIRATGLAKRFGDRAAVHDVDLALRPGSIHGLLGPNGAGKTTLLRMLLGTVRPDSGTISLGARQLAWDVPRGRCGIAGFVETPAFYPYLTASRNLELLSAWDGPIAHARVEELLELVGLADRAQSKVRSFSTGMRQRLGLAAALISEPRILIVDEPATGLDPAGIRDLHALLAAIAESGGAVLLSSHDLDEVGQLCTEVTVLRAGTVVYDGSIAMLRERAPQRLWRLHTGDDDLALLTASAHPGVDVRADRSGQLLVCADQAELDRFLIDLAVRGSAVRELHRDELPFESLFFQLTEQSCPDARAGATI